MKYNIIIFFISLGMLLFTFTIFNAKANYNKIPYDLFIEFNEKNKAELKNEIVENVLNASGKTQWLDNIDNSILNIQFGNIYGKASNEAVLTIKLDEKFSIVVLYKKEGTNFVYDCLVDTFFNIKDIQLLNLKENGKDIILIREYVDQLLGVYEVSTFIRGYIYDKNDFKLILNIVEDYKAYWNELWDNKIDPHWLQVKQNTKIRWENGVLPVVNVEYIQTLSISSSINSKTIPLDETFNVDKSRKVSESYYWSGKWNHFILSEGYNITTGQEVAIIEDLSNTVFNIVFDSNESYRIKNKDGKIEVVEKSKIKSLNQIRKSFFST